MRVLEDSSEQDMVRHEAAEALGGIATPEVLPILKAWATRSDAPRVVKESCVVALDMYEVRCPSVVDEQAPDKMVLVSL
jgi:deoxyhypusine monooxygenase